MAACAPRTLVDTNRAGIQLMPETSFAVGYTALF